MARKIRKTKISQEAEQVKAYFILFIICTIMTIIIFCAYYAEQKGYVTATIQEFEKWEYEWVADTHPSSYDRYIFYYYSCEFKDFDIQTGICVDKKWVPVGVKHKDEYIKYHKGDVITVSYSPEEYGKTGLVDVADRDKDNFLYIFLAVFFVGWKSIL